MRSDHLEGNTIVHTWKQRKQTINDFLNFQEINNGKTNMGLSLSGQRFTTYNMHRSNIKSNINNDQIWMCKINYKKRNDLCCLIIRIHGQNIIDNLSSDVNISCLIEPIFLSYCMTLPIFYLFRYLSISMQCLVQLGAGIYHYIYANRTDQFILVTSKKPSLLEKGKGLGHSWERSPGFILWHSSPLLNQQLAIVK